MTVAEVKRRRQRRQWQRKSGDESLARRPRRPSSGQPRPVRTACGEKRASSPGEWGMHAVCVRNVRLATPSTSRRADPSPPRNGSAHNRTTVGWSVRLGRAPPGELQDARAKHALHSVLSRRRQVMHTASHVRKTVDECPEREATTALGDLILISCRKSCDYGLETKGGYDWCVERT